MAIYYEFTTKIYHENYHCIILYTKTQIRVLRYAVDLFIFASGMRLASYRICIFFHCHDPHEHQMHCLRDKAEERKKEGSERQRQREMLR